jgi:DNA-directed RNA polymerase specialized sigma24 family protein
MPLFLPCQPVVVAVAWVGAQRRIDCKQRAQQGAILAHWKGRRQLRRPAAAEALTQDCFLHAYRAWERFRGDASIQTWLMRIVVNLLRDAARNRRLQFWKKVRADAALMVWMNAACSPMTNWMLKPTSWSMATVSSIWVLSKSTELEAAVDEQVLPELVAAVHLEHQSAEVAEPLLAHEQERAPLTPELARRRERAPDGTRRSGLGGCIERGRAAEPHRRRL